MQKTVACKLQPGQSQRQALKATLRAFADACNSALKVALETGRHRAFDIHHECYYAIKEQTGWLVYRKRTGDFYIHFVIERPEPVPGPQGTLGVDLGINRIATLSTTGTISGKPLNRRREKRSRIKASLQAKGTKGTKRVLKRLSGRERRFQSDMNHCLSKKIVAEAKANNLTIVLENLTGIRQRCNNKGRRMRRMLGRWAFFQLRSFICYKAKEAGVAVVLVNPAYTSKTCSSCGLAGSRRKHLFKCSCGFVCDADDNASLNIAAQGALVVFRDSVNRPETAVSRDKQQAA